MSRIASIHIPEGAGAFSLISQRVARAIVENSEYRPYFPGLRAYAEFKVAGVKIERAKRYAGDQKSFRQLFQLAWDAIFSYSFSPF